MSNHGFETNKSRANDTLAGYRDVHMKVWPETLDKMEELKNVLHVESETNAIRAALDIALAIARAITEGSDLIIEKKNGKKSKFSITGLQKGK